MPWVDFVKGQRKDDVAHEHLARFTGTEGVLFVGRAQEKATVFRTEKRRNRTTGQSYPWIAPATAVVNHFYFYCVDDDFGPFFLKFCSYFPYNARLCLNGHEWAKRQAEKAGIEFTALDNGFASCADPAALQAICDRFGQADIDALLRKWLARLPHPYPAADRAAGYRYDISILQAEFSLHPGAGPAADRPGVLRGGDPGQPRHRPTRPGRPGLRPAHRIDRRTTPRRFRTRVLTDGVTPSLHVDYKHCRIKQYHKENRALRTETTINDSTDFAHRQTAVQPARPAAGRLLRQPTPARRRTSQPRPDPRRRRPRPRSPRPAVVGTQRAAALRFDDPRAQALLSALLVVPAAAPRLHQPRPARPPRAPARASTPTPSPRPDHLPATPAAPARADRPDPRHATATGSPTTGLRTALFLTRAHNRLIRPGLAELTDPDPPLPSELRRAYDAFTAAVNHHTRRSGLAA